MTRTTPPSPEGPEPRSLSAVLRDLDGVPFPGDVDLTGAVLAGSRLRRRRRTGATLAVVAATAVLGLGVTRLGDVPAAPGPARAGEVQAGLSGHTFWELEGEGWSRLAPPRLVTPGVPDELQPQVLVNPSGSSVVVVIESGGCGGPPKLAAAPRTEGGLHLQYSEPEVPPDTACAASSTTTPYEVDLAPPLGPEDRVLLDLPWARADSAADVAGRAIGDLDPGETEVPVEQIRTVEDGAAAEGRTTADGTPVDQVFVDATGTRLRLRFAFSICATAVVRPPRENDAQVYLDVVVTDPGTTCQEPFYAEDFLVTLDAPLGDRQVIVSEESRTGPSAEG